MGQANQPLDGRTPVLVGAGQVTSHWAGEDANSAPSPQDLRRDAAALALVDSGRADALREAIDLVVAVRTTPDSIPGAPQPFGRCANPPATVAADLGIAGARGVYSQLGGDQPQALVNELATAVHAGEARAALLVGAEATRALKFAVRRGMTLDWTRSADGEMEDRGFGERLLSPYEITNGLGSPTQTYPAFEHALRTRLGNSRAEHMQLMSELWEGFARVAAANPLSQFPQAHTADYLSTPSAGNYPIADPYLKWHVAQDAVNQAAAVVITTVEEAERLGIDRAKWVFLHGHAKARDRLVTERADLSRSPPIELVLRQALDSSGKTVADIALFDLYSCFPVAVLLATEALGLDWRTTPATLTGGLPFFGGPGNNYSLHAIATMVAQLRERPGDFGLILANGGFLTKEAAGVYSTEPPAHWQPQSSAAIQAQVDAQIAPALLSEDCVATVETYTVVYKAGEPARGYAIAANDKGRILARTGKDDAALLAQLATHDTVGRSVWIEVRDGVNYVAALVEGSTDR